MSGDVISNSVKYGSLPIVKWLLEFRIMRISYSQNKKNKNIKNWKPNETHTRGSLVFQLSTLRQVTEFPIYFRSQYVLHFLTKSILIHVQRSPLWMRKCMFVCTLYSTLQKLFHSHLFVCRKHKLIVCAFLWWFTDSSLAQQHNTNRQKQSIYSIYCSISSIQRSLFFYTRWGVRAVCTKREREKENGARKCFNLTWFNRISALEKQLNRLSMVQFTRHREYRNIMGNQTNT